VQRVCELLAAGVADRVQIEAFKDERGAFGVLDDGGDAVAVDGFAAVEVAQRRPARPAAHLGFLALALFDLVCEVG
jgi:hypothetical protein